MTQMYSPIGGWTDVPGSEIDDLTKKGWFAEGTPGFVDRYAAKRAAQAQPLVQAQEPSIVEPQPEEPRRVGRSRRGAATDVG